MLKEITGETHTRFHIIIKHITILFLTSNSTKRLLRRKCTNRSITVQDITRDGNIFTKLHTLIGKMSEKRLASQINNHSAIRQAVTGSDRILYVTGTEANSAK